MKAKTRRISPAVIPLGLALFGPLQAFGGVDFERLDSDMRAVITNKDSSEKDLLEAISRLGRSAEPPSFWTTVANDQTIPTWHRRRCVLALFRRHGRFCTDLGKLGRVIAPAKWLDDKNITEVPSVVGWIPIDVNQNDTIFQIRVLPSSEGAAGNVYLKVMGKVKTDDFVASLRGTATPGLEGAVVLQYGFGDDYERWLSPSP